MKEKNYMKKTVFKYFPKSKNKLEKEIIEYITSHNMENFHIYKK